MSLAHDGSQPAPTMYAHFQTFGLSISDDGRYVLFESLATNLVPFDTNGDADSFVRDRVAQTTTRVSLSDAEGQLSEGGSSGAMSRDGRYIIFVSRGSDVVPGFGGGYSEVYRRDRTLGRTIPVSVTAAGGPANGYADGADMSGDGAFVSFRSSAPNLTTPGWEPGTRIYLRDVNAGTTTAISSYGGGHHGRASVSGDGRFVVYPLVQVRNGVEVNEARLFHRLGGSGELVGVSSAGAVANTDAYPGGVSDDGRFVAFASPATNLVPGDSNFAADAFLRERSPDPQPPPDACGNGIDDDGDSFVDFPDDPGCLDPLDPSESGWRGCDDGYDDDDDGLVDLADPGCSGPDDWSEAGECEDDEDNDGDGFVDHPDDPGCRTPSSLREEPQCQDGSNNDGQSGTDFDGGASVHIGVPFDVPDPQCAQAWQNREAAKGCGLGFELGLLLPLLVLRGRRLRRPDAATRS